MICPPLLPISPRPTRLQDILTGGLHPPYGWFTPAPGHQLGFNELKVMSAGISWIALSAQEPYVNFAEG